MVPVKGRGVEIQMVLYLPRDAVSVPVSRQVLDRCLETLGVTPDTRADIALALSEACANVVQHAGPGEEYEVQVSTRDRQCVIEVVNTAAHDRDPAADDSPARTIRDDSGPDEEWPGEPPFADDLVPVTAEHGRGLKIIDAVMDSMELTTTALRGTAVHFEKELEWLPGAAGQHLFHAGDSR